MDGSCIFTKVQTDQQILGSPYVVSGPIPVSIFCRRYANQYRLAPGIIVMQTVTVFFPIYDAYKSRRKTHSPSYTHWKTAQPGTMRRWTRAPPGPGVALLATRNPSHPKTFQDIQVIACTLWEKAAWATAPATSQARSTLFQQAVEIYIDNVSEKLAEFPINIEGSIRSSLDAVFGSAVANLQTRMQAGAAVVEPFDEATPFAKNSSLVEFPLSPLRSPPSQVFKHEMRNQTSQSTLGQRRSGEASKEIDNENAVFTSVAGFDERVFDSAENSIKYLVVTNTWRKFVS